jgi:hypothetical protein
LVNVFFFIAFSVGVQIVAGQARKPVQAVLGLLVGVE